MAASFSKNRVPIRLNDERWAHISDEHSELAGFRETILQVVTDPDRILAGSVDELLAVREVEPGKWLVVV